MRANGRMCAAIASGSPPTCVGIRHALGIEIARARRHDHRQVAPARIGAELLDEVLDHRAVEAVADHHAVDVARAEIAARGLDRERADQAHALADRDGERRIVAAAARRPARSRPRSDRSRRCRARRRRRSGSRSGAARWRAARARAARSAGAARGAPRRRRPRPAARAGRRATSSRYHREDRNDASRRSRRPRRRSPARRMCRVGRLERQHDGGRLRVPRSCAAACAGTGVADREIARRAPARRAPRRCSSATTTIGPDNAMEIRPPCTQQAGTLPMPCKCHVNAKG